MIRRQQTEGSGGLRRRPHRHTHTPEIASIPPALHRALTHCSCAPYVDVQQSQLSESAEEGGCDRAERIRGRRAAEDLWEQTLVI